MVHIAWPVHLLVPRIALPCVGAAPSPGHLSWVLALAPKLLWLMREKEVCGIAGLLSRTKGEPGNRQQREHLGLEGCASPELRQVI